MGVMTVKLRNPLVRAAVAAAIAGSLSTAASAASYYLNISGASAQRTLWESDLEAFATGKFGSVVDASNTTVCFLTKTNAALESSGFAVPDLHALVCTISSDRISQTPSLPTGVSSGDVVTMYYGAEFGSIWGISPFLTSSITGGTASRAATRGRMVLTPLATGGTQTVSSYNRDLDTASSGLTGPILVDIGVSDNEPVLWASQDNWSYSDGLSYSGPDGTGTNKVINVLGIPGQGQPTLTQLESLEQTWTYVNGEVFTFVVEPTHAPTNGITNLSEQSLRSIFTGQYKTWSEVPEVAAAGLSNASANIVVCRRDHGSGSEVTTSWFLQGQECGGNNGINEFGSAIGGPVRLVSANTNPAGVNEVNLAQTGTLDGFTSNPIENFSTNDIKSCLAANPGVSIGLAVLGPSGSYTTLKVDGIEANAHNAAFGIYPFYAEDWGYNGAAAHHAGAALNLANQLFTDVSVATSGVLPTENGSMVSGSWVASGTASGQITNFYLENGINPAPTMTSSSQIGNPSVPIAIWNNANSAACTIEVGDNT
jgi:hypothetical protein